MTRVAIVGASGFTGHELLKILRQHPEVEVVALNSRSFAGQKVADLYKDFNGDDTYTGYSYDELNDLNLDFAFLALPNGHSMEAARALTVPKIIDLSADYRFKDPAMYEKVYGQPQLASDRDWVFGLPELFRDDIKQADAVANIGCYVTASLLATLPIQQLASYIVLDCKSGWSGAGRESPYAIDPSIIKDNLVAYKLTNHRHKAEIEQYITTPLSFTPHVFDTYQGMMCTAHILLKAAADPVEIRQLYQEYYKDHPFVRIRDDIPQVRDTQQTNYCDIGGFEIDDNNQLVIVSTIDNLWKGAAGQTVQNMNLMLGFEETAGLL